MNRKVTALEMPKLKLPKAVCTIVREQGCHRGAADTDIQFSRVIRPARKDRCGFISEPGEQRIADLKPFGRYHFAVAMTDAHREQSTVLYLWRRRGVIVYGATLTDAKGRILETRIRNYTEAGIATVWYLEKSTGLKPSKAGRA